MEFSGTRYVSRGPTAVGVGRPGRMTGLSEGNSIQENPES